MEASTPSCSLSACAVRLPVLWKPTPCASPLAGPNQVHLSDPLRPRMSAFKIRILEEALSYSLHATALSMFLCLLSIMLPAMLCCTGCCELDSFELHSLRMMHEALVKQ